MKIKIMLVVLGLSTLFFLSGCEKVEEEKITVTFIQLEKQDDEAYAIFADDANKVYYKMAINSYEYNHWDIEENTVFENLAVQKNYDPGWIGQLEIQFNHKWHQLYETDYFEEENM